jgi:hypothetical protein
MSTTLQVLSIAETEEVEEAALSSTTLVPLQVSLLSLD